MLKLYSSGFTQAIDLKFLSYFAYYNVFRCDEFVGCSSIVAVVITKRPPEKGVLGAWNRVKIQIFYFLQPSCRASQNKAFCQFLLKSGQIKSADFVFFLAQAPPKSLDPQNPFKKLT